MKSTVIMLLVMTGVAASCSDTSEPTTALAEDMPFQSIRGGSTTIHVKGTPADNDIAIDESISNIPCPTGGCPPNLGEVFGMIVCTGGCTVTGPVTAVDASTWAIGRGGGNGVDDRYRILGNGGRDRVRFDDGDLPDGDRVFVEADFAVSDPPSNVLDGPGNDSYRFIGGAGDNYVAFSEVNGSGDDRYRFDGKGGMDQIWIVDGAGNDEYYGTGIEIFGHQVLGLGSFEFFRDDETDGGDRIIMRP